MIGGGGDISSLVEHKTPFAQGQDRFIQWMLRRLDRLEADNSITKSNVKRHEDALNFKGRIPEYTEYLEEAE